MIHRNMLRKLEPCSVILSLSDTFFAPSYNQAEVYALFASPHMHAFHFSGVNSVRCWLAVFAYKLA